MFSCTRQRLCSEVGWRAFISPSLTQSYMKVIRTLINTLSSKRDGAIANEPQCWRPWPCRSPAPGHSQSHDVMHAPARPAALGQHHRAEQSRLTAATKAGRGGPHRGERKATFLLAFFWSVLPLHSFETFSSVSPHPSFKSLRCKMLGNKLDLIQPRKGVTEHSRKRSMVYKNIELLCCTPETNRISHNYIMHVVCKAIIPSFWKRNRYICHPHFTEEENGLKRFNSKAELIGRKSELWENIFLSPEPLPSHSAALFRQLTKSPLSLRCFSHSLCSCWLNSFCIHLRW